MENFKFINKKHIKGKDKEFYNCNLYSSDLDSIVTIFTDQKTFDRLVYKFGEIVKSSDISSTSYVNKYGQTVTSYKFV